MEKLKVFGVIILVLGACYLLLRLTYNDGIKSCTEAGYSESYCENELKKQENKKMKEYWLGVWRTFKHKVNYVDGYYKKVMIILLLLILIDLVVLWVIW